MTQNELEYLKEKEKHKVLKSKSGIVMQQSKKFEEYFCDIQTKEDRNYNVPRKTNHLIQHSYFR